MALRCCGTAVDPACCTPELRNRGIPQHYEPRIKVVASHFANRKVPLEQTLNSFGTRPLRRLCAAEMVFLSDLSGFSHSGFGYLVEPRGGVELNDLFYITSTGVGR